MNCKECQQRIVDELASKQAQSAREVAAHRVGCAICQQFYDEQSALFSRIDTGMRSLTNEAVPTSLFAKTRGALPQRAERPVVPLWGYAVLAMACAVMLSFIYWHRQSGDQKAMRAEQSVGRQISSSTLITGPVQVEATPPINSIQPARNTPPKAALTGPKVGSVAGGPDLQIVTSEDERRAFVQWVTALPKQRDSRTAFAKPLPDKPVQPMEIALMKVDNVDVQGMKTEAPSMK